MRQIIGWTRDDDKGVSIDVEASRNRNQWTFRRRRNRRHEWETFSPELVDWETLLDTLQRKYQRRRCAWRDVEQVQAFLDEARK
ncbi:MAG: hypothetical protein JJU29_18420 [Verrucomicrobia bacterium]|nr:hypothetical protein [Verrucomicrobiota bacterium]